MNTSQGVSDGQADWKTNAVTQSIAILIPLGEVEALPRPQWLPLASGRIDIIRVLLKRTGSN